MLLYSTINGNGKSWTSVGFSSRITAAIRKNIIQNHLG